MKKEAEEFFEKKPKKVLLVGDSHLKMISAQELRMRTGKDISVVKAYCSRKNWYGALFPDISFSNALEENADGTTTHIIMCSPTSDLTNVKDLDASSKLMFADLSAKTMVTTAEWCFSNYPSLQKVVIFEHLPRYFWNLSVHSVGTSKFKFYVNLTHSLGKCSKTPVTEKFR